MAYPDIPHLELPLRRARGAYVAVEQDSADDVASCVRALFQTPEGHLDANPAYGLAEQAFMPADGERLRALIERWEPRAAAVVSDDPDRVTDALREVGVAL
jgi:phage baseplate assembly protein W